MVNSVIGRDLAVDLGTSSTLAYARGRGVVLDEPSVLAVNGVTGEVVAVGEAAKLMIGRTPEHIRTVRPLRDSALASGSTTERLLRQVIAQVHRRRYFVKPRMVLCLPTGLGAIEQRAVVVAAYAAGARQVSVLAAPMAAAIGAGLPVHEPRGNMVVDVGGRTTEAAVIALGGVAVSRAVETAGDRLDEVLVAWLEREHDLVVGEHTAEQVKIALGSAYPLTEELEADVRGRDKRSGLPRTVTLFSTEVRRALEAPVGEIADAVRAVLDQTPPELATDVSDRGIVLTGGGALLRGLDVLLRLETGIPVHVADQPRTSVVLGAGRCVEEYDALHQVLEPAELAVANASERESKAVPA